MDRTKSQRRRRRLGQSVNRLNEIIVQIPQTAITRAVVEARLDEIKSELDKTGERDWGAIGKGLRDVRKLLDDARKGKFSQTGDVKSVAPTPSPQHNRDPEEAIRGAKMVEDDRIITKGGVHYVPLSLAAQLAQAPRQTVLHWIKNKTKFAGHALESYDSPTAAKFYVSEESIQRMANRFVKWPSTLPAGPVTIGKTENRNGFLGLPDAARILRVSPRTMWLWATQGKAPSQEPLEVIKCTTSDHFYIRERDVFALKELVPRSGLQRGRRQQTTPQP
jgi:hypothetical protein